MPANKISELLGELHMVLAGKGSRVFDSTVPLVVYLLLNSIFSGWVGTAGAAGAALLLLILRLLRRESPVYALGGFGAAALAVVFSQLAGTGTGFFVPGLLSGAISVALCVVSVLLNRPLVAWTSHLTRRWPRQWYWHKKVLPAYNEVTIAWGVVFALRLWVQYSLFLQGDVGTLGLVQLFLGWPFTVLLLIASYLYGQGRLRSLSGPSVEEFKAGAQPPWQGQRQGF
ncbi:MAG: DUF3159 domain-containing protein [Anaerolineales bacterium]|nr:DUF3159 domain-containing protein [Anaerolineales bacterium]